MLSKSAVSKEERTMRFLVSAGPTREALDPVRFLSNRSSGRMGYAIAEVAAKAGYDVVLVSGPVGLECPAGVRRISVVSALEMLAALEAEFTQCDVLVMAAAVADWRPESVATGKLKKSTMSQSIKLVANPDILLHLKKLKTKQLVVGFAAETENVEENALEKLQRKGMDLMVANDVSQPDAGFEVETNRVILIDSAGGVVHLPLLSKYEVAEQILPRIESLGSAT